MFSILRAWASLQRSQWFDRGKLREIQRRKLKRILNHAYHNVAFYKSLYRSHGIDSTRIKSIADLRKLPTITRNDLQNEPLAKRTAIDANLSSCKLTTTSGTSGSPVQVYDDALSVPYRDAQNLRLLWAYGVRPLHRICKMRVGDPTGVRPMAFLSEVGLWGFLRRNLLQQILYDSEIDSTVEMISKWKPKVIFGQGSYLTLLLERSKSLGRDMESQIVIATGEVLDGLTRSQLENGFHASVYDHYGMEEVGGSVAWECPTHFGYHVNDETVVLEFMRDGETVNPGEPGEIYITSLTHMATPIIRYATGDIATSIDEECECGRNLSMLRDIQGRVLDALVTRNGRHVFTAIARLQEVGGLNQFHVVQNEDYSIDLYARIAAGMEMSTLEELQRVCTELLGSIPVRIVKVERIDLVPGRKFRVIESKLRSRE